MLSKLKGKNIKLEQDDEKSEAVEEKAAFATILKKTG